MRIWTDKALARATPYARRLLADLLPLRQEILRELMLMKKASNAGDETARANHLWLARQAREAIRRIRRDAEVMGACARGRQDAPRLLFPMVRGAKLGWRTLRLGARRAGPFVAMDSVPAATKERARPRKA
jgi:hypothetical protein